MEEDTIQVVHQIEPGIRDKGKLKEYIDYLVEKMGLDIVSYIQVGSSDRIHLYLNGKSVFQGTKIQEQIIINERQELELVLD